MLKLTVAVLAVALAGAAGAAGAAGWRSMRLEASDEASFAKSVAELQKKLSPSRRYAFAWALQGILVHGVTNAEADQREYTARDFFRQVDGLGYDEVMTLLDPTGEMAHRYRAAYYYSRGAGCCTSYAKSPWPTPPPPIGYSGEQSRGGTYTNPFD